MATSTVSEEDEESIVVLVVAAVEENAPATQRLQKNKAEIASGEERIRVIIFKVQLRFIMAYQSLTMKHSNRMLLQRKDEEKLNLASLFSDACYK